MRFSPRIAGISALSLALAAGACFVPGCGGGAKSVDPVNTGLAKLAEGDPDPAPFSPPETLALTPEQAELYRLAEESALNLQAVFDQLNRASTPPAAEQTVMDSPALALAELGEEGAAVSAADEAEALAHNQPDPAPVSLAEAEAPPEGPLLSPKPPEKPLPERIRETTIVLVDLLRQQSTTDAAPLRAYFSLAALEVLWPGALLNIITPDGGGGGLPADQQAAVEAFRNLATGVAALPQQPGPVMDGLFDLAEELSALRPMRVHNATLCSRVAGFGQYTPVPSMRFLHGRGNPVIIYTEVASFAHRPATSSEAARMKTSTANPDAEAVEFWAVELSQEVQIFHDVDGLLVWSRPEQTVLDVSRNRRRDFFLVNEIVLPRTLSVGRYQMKITMRDKTSGHLDEAILSFEVVADPALARGE